MTIIEQIKAEIGKNLDALNKVKHLATFSEEHGYNHGFEDAMRDLLSFLSTLESEKPMNPDDAMKELDEKIALVKQRGTWDGVDVDKYMDEVRGREPEKPIEELEEEIVKVCDDFVIPLYFPLYGLDDEYGRELINKIARHFAQWGAEQILREVERWVEKNTCRYIDTQNDEEGYITDVFLENAFVDDLKKATKEIFTKWGAEHLKK